MRTLSYAIIFALLTSLGLANVAGAREHARGDGVRQGRPSAGHAPGRGFQNRVQRRQSGQRSQIRRGARSGQLTRSELSRLRRDQKQIARMERHFGADGRYSRHERRVLKRSMKLAGKRIHHATHNRRHARRSAARRHHHWRHRRVHRRHVYPVYVESSGRSHSLEVEFDGVRFAWAESR
jgi:hypothetical protein